MDQISYSLFTSANDRTDYYSATEREEHSNQYDSLSVSVVIVFINSQQNDLYVWVVNVFRDPW